MHRTDPNPDSSLTSTPYHSQEYDASGAPDQRLARRRHLVNAAAPQLTELFLEVRDGSLGGGGGDAAAWRRGRVATRSGAVRRERSL